MEQLGAKLSRSFPRKREFRVQQKAELESAILEVRLELERAHRFELERLLADRPENEESSAASKLRLA